jgi:hypothetical protein
VIDEALCLGRPLVTVWRMRPEVADMAAVSMREAASTAVISRSRPLYGQAIRGSSVRPSSGPGRASAAIQLECREVVPKMGKDGGRSCGPPRPSRHAQVAIFDARLAQRNGGCNERRRLNGGCSDGVSPSDCTRGHDIGGILAALRRRVCSFAQRKRSSLMAPAR